MKREIIFVGICLAMILLGILIGGFIGGSITGVTFALGIVYSIGRRQAKKAITRVDQYVKNVIVNNLE